MIPTQSADILHHTLTTMKSIISNVFPLRKWQRAIRATPFFKMTANTSRMSFQPNTYMSSHVFPREMLQARAVRGSEHLLFTLVFNLKFNLLKQLKAYTSQSNIHTHSSQPSSRLNYHSVAQCEVGSTFPLLSNFDRQFIRTAIECRMVKDRMKIAKNATKLNRLHSRRLVLMRLTVATM